MHQYSLIPSCDRSVRPVDQLFGSTFHLCFIVSSYFGYPVTRSRELLEPLCLLLSESRHRQVCKSSRHNHSVHHRHSQVCKSSRHNPSVHHRHRQVSKSSRHRCRMVSIEKAVTTGTLVVLEKTEKNVLNDRRERERDR